MIPLRGALHFAPVIGQTRDSRVLFRGDERTDRTHHEARGNDLAALDMQVPSVVPLIPLLAQHIHAEPHMRIQPEAPRHLHVVLLDLRAGGESLLQLGFRAKEYW